MPLTIIQVDAFTDVPFAGNPAAVCVLPQFPESGWLQKVAQEMNLSETAFLVQRPDGYDLRWFTPAVEVDLCGHATLASAHALWTEGHSHSSELHFHTRSGVLTASRQQDWIELNFPANPPTEVAAPPALQEAIAHPIARVTQSTLGYLVELEGEALVRQLQPDLALLKSLSVPGVIVTSLADRSSEFEFVSRFFAPCLGIDEDPVTGAAHCVLAPYWRDRLHQSEFLAYQASARGGVVRVRCADDRVVLGGKAITVLRGELMDASWAT